VAASGDCGPSMLGLTDADKDNIPASYEATYKDCTEDKFWWFEVKNGVASVKDTDDNNKDSGFTTGASNLRTDFFDKNSDGTQKNKTLSVLHNWDVTVSKSPSQASVDYNLSVDITGYKNNQIDKTWNGALNFTGFYVPAQDNDLNNFDAGTINFDGELKLGDFVVREKITNLTFDDVCAGAKSGSIRFEDGRGNFFEMTYTGCGSGTYTYNSSGSGTFPL
jgi:hypothetical protein